jgi:hypothetical protein
MRDAEGLTLNEKTILRPKDANTSAVYEELIHSTQFRKEITTSLNVKESLRFRVITSGYLPVAEHWYIDGMLEAGEICPSCTGTVNIENRKINITISTVALVSAKKPEKNRLTLSIQNPNVPIEKLNNVMIIGTSQ